MVRASNKQQDVSRFTASPGGQQLTLKGSSGVLVIIHGSDLHTSYSGSIGRAFLLDSPTRLVIDVQSAG